MIVTGIDCRPMSEKQMIEMMCRRVGSHSLSGQGVAVLEGVDRHVLGAVVLEGPSHVVRLPDEEQVAEEDPDLDEPLDGMFQQAPLRRKHGACDDQRQEEEEPDPEGERDRQHERDAALAQLDPLLGGGEVCGADEPARPGDEGLVQDDESPDERELRPASPAEPAGERLRRVDDASIRVAERDGDRAAAAHEDALDEGLSAVAEARHGTALRGRCGDEGTRAGQRPVAARSRRFWKRSTWPAVSMIICLPVKNGWQEEQTSTRRSVRVEPTVNALPHVAQDTVAWWYLGWISGFTWCSRMRVGSMAGRRFRPPGRSSGEPAVRPPPR
jgi:hypothetical protein